MEATRAPFDTGAKVPGAPSSPNLVRFFTRDEYLGRIGFAAQDLRRYPDRFLASAGSRPSGVWPWRRACVGASSRMGS